VSPELVEVAASGPSKARWHQSFDTTLVDVFAVRASVATEVADHLGVVLSPPAQAELARPPTQNITAYEAFLRSIALVGNDPTTMRHALAAAEEAVTLMNGSASTPTSPRSAAIHASSD
jgi:adenylate cyclase